MITIFKSHTGDQVMVDSNAEIAFGPVFGSDEDPQEFIGWLKHYHEWLYPEKCNGALLAGLVDDWRKEVEELA